MNFMKPALIALSAICLATCLFGAARHKVTPRLELLPGELDLRSTHSRERWRGTPQRVPPLFLPDGRMVVVAADSVYMLNVWPCSPWRRFRRTLGGWGELPGDGFAAGAVI